MKRSVLPWTGLHCVSECMFCVRVCAHVVKHSCWAKGFSCHRGLFSRALHAIGGSRRITPGVGELWGSERLRGGKKERTTVVWNAFFRESKLGQTGARIRAVFVKANHVGNDSFKSHTERETQGEERVATQGISHHKNN